MSEFKLDEGLMKSEMNSLKLVKSELYIYKAALAFQILKLRSSGNDSVVRTIKSKLGIESKRISNEIININSLINTGNTICSKAKTAEKAANLEMSGLSDIAKNTWPFVTGNIGAPDISGITINNITFVGFPFLSLLISGISGLTSGNPIAEYNSNVRYKVDSIVFDDVGSFGGNQGHAAGETNKYIFTDKDYLYKAIRKYYPGISKEECNSFLLSMNKSGCGYTALANSIFMKYEGNETEFKRRFGFNMYRNGDLNFDRMIIAIYAETSLAGINTGPESKYAGGYTLDTQDDVINNFLKNHGLVSDVKHYTSKEITVDTFEKYSKKGPVWLSYIDDNGLNLKPVGSNNWEYHPKGEGKDSYGHAMMITGVTDDGMFIVSSWGKKYYLDPSSLDGDRISVVDFHDIGPVDNPKDTGGNSHVYC